MRSFGDFLERLGGLHDARVVELRWSPGSAVLELTLEDLYSNFLGLAEYPAPLAGSIEFRGVSGLLAQFEPAGRAVAISEARLLEGERRAEIRFWPGGCLKLDFTSVEFPVSALARLGESPSGQ